MSNFRAMTRATDSALEHGLAKFKDWQPASWMDNYFGSHKYGIRFDSDPISVYVDDGKFIYSPDMEIPDKTKRTNPNPTGMEEKV